MSQNPQEATYWKKCSSCKNEIGFNSIYKLCSVSTCRSKRTGYVFCSVPCWDAHLGFANHREAYAEEYTSPTRDAYLRSLNDSEKTREPVRRKVTTSVGSAAQAPEVSSGGTYEVDTLIVVSKVKKFIQEQSGFNTSHCGVDALTQKVVQECLKAIEVARGAERKTVMGRDVK